MKTFTASHLSHKPAEVFEEARTNGAIIQQKRTNGDVIEEFVLIKNDYRLVEHYDRMGEVASVHKSAKGGALDTLA